MRQSCITIHNAFSSKILMKHTNTSRLFKRSDCYFQCILDNDNALNDRNNHLTQTLIYFYLF